MIICQISQGRLHCQELLGQDPDVIHLPLQPLEYATAFREILSLQSALADYLNYISHMLPLQKPLNSLTPLLVQPKSLLSDSSIPGACTVFVDGSGKTGQAAVVWRDGNDCTSEVTTLSGSTQVVELGATHHALFLFQHEALNPVADSAHVVGIVHCIQTAFIKAVSNNFFSCYKILPICINRDNILTL